MNTNKKTEAKTNRHWLTVPLFFFVVFFLSYIYFFSSNGYFAYKNMLTYKEKLQQRNQQLEEEKTIIQERLQQLQNDSAALEVFTPVYFLYQDDVSVIKFLQLSGEQPQENPEKKNYDIYFLQQMFVTVVSGFMLLLTLFFWYRQKKSTY